MVNDKTIIGLSQEFHFTKLHLDSVVSVVKILKQCEELQTDHNRTYDESLLYKEIVSQVGNTKSEMRYRSHQCQYILPINQSISLTCTIYKLHMKMSDSKYTYNSAVPTSTSISDDSHSEEVELCEENHHDLLHNKIFPNCYAKMTDFLMSQKMVLEKNKHGRRWNKDIVRLCLTLWCRSAKGYTELCKNGFVELPSQQLLRKYKNTVQQEAGINSGVLNWMANEAVVTNIPPEGYEGGILIDEMSIQSDLQLCKRNGKIELIGFTELSPESVVMDKIRNGTSERPLATHVLQFVFIGFTEFRFPFAHFPSTTASSADLYLQFWKAVHMLAMFDFRVKEVDPQHTIFGLPKL
jgi:hypothetical protein